ncbi:thioredoxin [Streptococcus sp. UBA3373]|uniref:thioredoxin n=1 Tax=Streptococcus sp. UBA3373 TaxID=1947562 RepID=UPI0025D0BEB5|nr:thioredoxin [Streptococcus sp. UBA3373]
MKVIEITKENFAEEVLKSDKPVLVDFWAAWCGPCRMLSPVIEEIAEELDDVKVCKVNIDEQETIASDFNIMSIPTLIVFKKGQPVDALVGVNPKEKIIELVRK